MGGREFSVRKQFLDDLKSNDVLERVASLRKPLLVMHSPIDDTVGVDNATKIFSAAKHPKSFVSLDKADHLLGSSEDANFAAGVIAAWADKYIASAPSQGDALPQGVTRITETGNGKFQATVQTGTHRLIADEPENVGGLDSGPSPYDYLATALGTCTSMTLRMYADFKKLEVGKITVDVSHEKIHAKDCSECVQKVQEKGGKIDVFERKITVSGLENEAIKAKLVEIADKCPVHKTLENSAIVHTSYGA